MVHCVCLCVCASVECGVKEVGANVVASRASSGAKNAGAPVWESNLKHDSCVLLQIRLWLH